LPLRISQISSRFDIGGGFIGFGLGGGEGAINRSDLVFLRFLL
jgi:hypothetical protein